MLRLAFIVLISGLLFLHCRRDVDSVTADPGAILLFSETTIEFDTIFTTVGSVTKQITVYNPNVEAVLISSISISGDQNTYFRMNVDGVPGQTVNNIFLAGLDSLFLFIDVTIDPNNSNTPFLVTGQIDFVTNGNDQSISLLAYGQQAIFYTPNQFPENLPAYRTIENGENKSFTWQADTPIVIYGYLVIDSLQSLTIEKGTQIYLHANSGIWVYRYGQIAVNGTKEEPVVFQGDRLDGWGDVAGSWDRIWINDGGTTQTNIINWAVIKNAFIGLQVEHNPFYVNTDPYSLNGLLVQNTIIENCKLVGIYSKNYTIYGVNTVVSDCGESNFYVAGGGFYNFTHCTFANYFREDIRNGPAVYLTNYYTDPRQQANVENSLQVDFNNCIIYGDQDDEFGIEDELEPLDNLKFNMYNTLLNVEIDTALYGKYKNCIFNPENETVFASPYSGNFELASGSEAIDKGNPNVYNNIPSGVRNIIQTIAEKDLNGNTRSTTTPDLGAYEN